MLFFLKSDGFKESGSCCGVDCRIGTVGIGANFKNQLVIPDLVEEVQIAGVLKVAAVDFQSFACFFGKTENVFKVLFRNHAPAPLGNGFIALPADPFAEGMAYDVDISIAFQSIDNAFVFRVNVSAAI